jgi:Xaa-Pro aminopeptidase
MLIERTQEALREHGLGGWLFFDHHHRDPLAYRILQLPDSAKATRRWYYFIPSQGEPRKLVHRIESQILDSLPGTKQAYSSWQEQQRTLHAMIASSGKIAMQYSDHCAIPYVAMVDAGTIELVRDSGVQIVSSADLVQEFEAIWTEEQLSSHVEAGKLVDQVRAEAFGFVGKRLRMSDAVTEYEVQQFILKRFEEEGLVTDHGPIVGVNGNASNPHYEPTCEVSSHIRTGDVLLIDLWAKKNTPGAVYYDVTWTGFCSDTIPDHIQKVFDIVKTARVRASQFAIDRVTAGTPVCGFEVDDVARGYIKEQGYSEYFFHRTGHSIGTEVHGTGANMDNLESHDERRLIPQTCFSVEPGIYLPEFGIRSEVNVYVGKQSAFVTGQQQDRLILV